MHHTFQQLARSHSLRLHLSLHADEIHCGSLKDQRGKSDGEYMALRDIVDMPRDVDSAVSLHSTSAWCGPTQRKHQAHHSAHSSTVSLIYTTLGAYLHASVWLGIANLNNRDTVLAV